MDWDGKKVTADKRKGKIILYTSEEETLTHIQWVDREKNDTALDLIVINDAYFQKVEKVKDGRVYLLRFTTSDKKLFFWMQEPKEDGDAELIKKFNESVGATVPDKKVAGAAGSAAPAPAAAVAAGAGAGAAGMDPALNAILQQFLQSQGQQGPRAPPIPLAAVLTPEVLQGLMSDEAAVAEMRSLVPDTHKSPEGVHEALGSPQLQQSLRALTQAVHSDQLPVLFASLGLDPSVIAQAPPGSDAVEILCKAMEKKMGGGPGGGSSS